MVQLGQRYRYIGDSSGRQFICEVTKVLSDLRAEIKLIQDLGYGAAYGRCVGYVFCSENVTNTSVWEYLVGQDAPKN